MSRPVITIKGARVNNLKNIDVEIPRNKLTVITGLSGSGKSSLAFETLFAEGQRRFIESMSNYARQFLNKAPKPDIEGVNNIPPAISIEQKNSVKSSRSTVGTTTELIDYMRLLFEKIGVAHCPTHKVRCEKQSVTQGTDLVLEKFGGARGYVLTEINETGRVAQGKKLHSFFSRMQLTHRPCTSAGDGMHRILRRRQWPSGELLEGPGFQQNLESWFLGAMQLTTGNRSTVIA